MLKRVEVEALLLFQLCRNDKVETDLLAVEKDHRQSGQDFYVTVKLLQN